LEQDPEGLLRLVGEEHLNLNDVNVSTAFSKLGRLCGSRSFPRNIAADDRFRGLMAQARAMCADGRMHGLLHQGVRARAPCSLPVLLEASVRVPHAGSEK
jgi:hypothetical protein